MQPPCLPLRGRDQPRQEPLQVLNRFETAQHDREHILHEIGAVFGGEPLTAPNREDQPVVALDQHRPGILIPRQAGLEQVGIAALIVTVFALDISGQPSITELASLRQASYDRYGCLRRRGAWQHPWRRCAGEGPEYGPQGQPGGFVRPRANAGGIPRGYPRLHVRAQDISLRRYAAQDASGAVRCPVIHSRIALRFTGRPVAGRYGAARMSPRYGCRTRRLQWFPEKVPAEYGGRRAPIGHRLQRGALSAGGSSSLCSLRCAAGMTGSGYLFRKPL